MAENKNTNDHILDNSEDSFGINELYRLSGYLYFRIGEYQNAIKYFKKANVKKNILN